MTSNHGHERARRETSRQARTEQPSGWEAVRVHAVARRWFRVGAVGLLGLLTWVATVGPSPARAAVIYVDNVLGHDDFDGSSPEVRRERVGPVRTIARAVQMARPGDVISVANRGRPYYESIQLVGPRCSGLTFQPPRAGERCRTDVIAFQLQGHGAVVSGARPVSPGAWQRLPGRLWRFEPYRKGYFLLLKDEKPLPESPRPKSEAELNRLPEGHWCVWRGCVYYRARLDELPPLEPFQYAAEDVGLTLYAVRNVRISDLVFRHFRLDGVNAHDLCRCVVLENVVCQQNGRSGLTVAGSSRLTARRCRFVDNRVHSVLITEMGEVRLEQVEVSKPPTVAE